MPWDESLFDLLDDLEAQAEALYAAERDAELADRSRAEYATVTLEGRLMASIGRAVTLDVEGVGRVAGELRRVGRDWFLVHERGDGQGVGRDTLVPTAGVAWAEGLSERAVPEVARPALSRLGLGSALRRLADAAAPCVVVTRTGRHDVVLRRVGGDFVEAETIGDEPRRVVIALGALGVVRSAG